MKAQETNAPIFTAYYELLGWVLDRVETFPKSQRFIFGQRLGNHALDGLELILHALYSRTKLAHIEQAGREVEILRVLLRLCVERKLVSKSQYEFAAGKLAEIGRMLGGWIRQQKSR